MGLTKLNVEKESLLSSGIGKVVLFYTRSKQPEPSIKRMAERLLGEWSRPILKRTDDYKKRAIESREYDYQYVPFMTQETSTQIHDINTTYFAGQPSLHRDKRQDRSSASLSAQRHHLQKRSERDSWHQRASTTRLGRLVCPQVTQSRPGATSTEPELRTIDHWARVAWMRSER
jgi:hypothetical protein